MFDEFFRFRSEVPWDDFALFLREGFAEFVEEGDEELDDDVRDMGGGRGGDLKMNKLNKNVHLDSSFGSALAWYAITRSVHCKFYCITVFMWESMTSIFLD